MALWGTGAGRQEGPAGEGQKVPEACTAVALLNRLLETPDPREGVTAQRRAQVTQGSQQAPESLSVGPWQHPGSLGLSLLICGMCGLDTHRN